MAGTSPHEGGPCASLHSQLRQRLVTLAYRFEIVNVQRGDAHAVEEIERPLPALWIQVQVDPPLSTNPREQENYWALLRETLTLLGVMARIDYDAWLKLLTDTGMMDIPRFFDRTKQRLPCRFRLDFEKGQRERQRLKLKVDYSWLGFGALFQCERAVRVRRSMQEALETVETPDPILIPIDLDLQLATDETTAREQAEMLKRLTEDFAKACNSAHDQETAHRTVWLQPEQLDLNLQDVEIHGSVFKEATRLLETGVAIHSLTLPSKYSPWRTSQHQVLEALSTFACTLCGYSPNPTARSSPRSATANVRHVVIPTVYLSTSFLRVPLFSALAKSTQIKALSVQGTSSNDTQQGGEACFHAWLAYALWSSRASPSIETVHINSLHLNTTLLDRWARVIHAQDPVRALYAASEEPNPMSTRAAVYQELVLPSGTVLRPRYHDQDVRLPSDWSGEIVEDDSTKPTMVVLLPGLGFCEIDRQLVPRKRQRKNNTESSSSPDIHAAEPTGNPTIQRLSLGHRMWPWGDNGTLVAQFLALVGQHVTALSLYCPQLSDDGLEHALLQCPQLTTLQLTSGRFDAMTGLLRAYERGAKIASIDLSGLLVDDLEAFLNILATQGSRLQHTLKKLRIQSHNSPLYRQATLQVLIRIVRDHHTLTHLHLLTANQAWDLPWSSVSACDGHVIPTGDSLPWPQRLASMGALQRTATPLPHVDTDALALIFAFAAPTLARMVLVERD